MLIFDGTYKTSSREFDKVLNYVYTGDGNVAFRTSEDAWAWQ